MRCDVLAAQPANDTISAGSAVRAISRTRLDPNAVRLIPGSIVTSLSAAVSLRQGLTNADFADCDCPPRSPRRAGRVNSLRNAAKGQKPGAIKFVKARAPSPTREARVLPRLGCVFEMRLSAAVSTATRTGKLLAESGKGAEARGNQVREGEGAFTNTRGACAPQTES